MFVQIFIINILPRRKETEKNIGEKYKELYQ